jgi:hypothetical protein
VISYPVTSYYSGAVIGAALTPPVVGNVGTTWAVPAAVEVLPAPMPNETYPYDGGPPNLVPMPPAAVAPPLAVPAVGVNRTKVGPTRTPLTYPAYGEDRTAPPAAVNPRLVKASPN